MTQELFLDKLGCVYGIEVSFEYGKAYKEFENPLNNELEALNTAINNLLFDVATY